jgi:putative GTP pyrophosphokinase
MSDREELTYVEVQIRTIAMDFWASLEHKIFYKYNKEVPEHMIAELKDASVMADKLDRKMERLHKEISEIKQAERNKDERLLLDLSNGNFTFPFLENFIQKTMDDKK